MAADNTIRLTANGREFKGWQRVRVTRGVERVPADFEIEMTDRAPNLPLQLDLEPGMACQVYAGKDLLITGWIDRVGLQISPHDHLLHVAGRSRICDLLDCSLTTDVLNGMQVVKRDLLDLVNDLGAKFKIKGRVLNNAPTEVHGPNGTPLQFNVVLTETPWDVLERVARRRGVLLYDDTDGNLLIASVGSFRHTSGFAFAPGGGNVEAAQVQYTIDERYSDYLPYLMSTDTLGNDSARVKSAPIQDKGVTRFRPLIVVSEQFDGERSFAVERAQWEAGRRAGRSRALRFTCSTWRDSKDILWQPNGFAPVSFPSLKCTPKVPWVIASVTYSYDIGSGTIADLVMMPIEAFTAEPIILMPTLNNPADAQSGQSTGVAGQRPGQ